MQWTDAQVEAWGDRQTKKRKHTFRLLLQNIQRLPLSARNPKHEAILHWLFTDEADAAVLTEVNTYWPNVRPHQQWKERTIRKIVPQGAKHRFAHNCHGSVIGMIQYMEERRRSHWDPTKGWNQILMFTDPINLKFYYATEI
jgi:hypothetical protein